MSSLNMNLQDNKYNVGFTVNENGTRTYELSTNVYVKNIGKADISFKLTQDSYGAFISASGNESVNLTV